MARSPEGPPSPSQAASFSSACCARPGRTGRCHHRFTERRDQAGQIRRLSRTLRSEGRKWAFCHVGKAPGPAFWGRNPLTSWACASPHFLGQKSSLCTRVEHQLGAVHPSPLGGSAAAGGRGHVCFVHYQTQGLEHCTCTSSCPINAPRGNECGLAPLFQSPKGRSVKVYCAPGTRQPPCSRSYGISITPEALTASLNSTGETAGSC